MVIVVHCKIYIICREAAKINSELLDLLILSEWDEEASTWQSLVVVIHTCPTREAWKVLEDPCLKMV